MSRILSRALVNSAAVFGAALFAPGAFAQTTPDAFEQVVVVANRAPVDLSKVGNSVTVLDTATIQQRQTVEVGDLLTQTPGITENGNGGPGTSAAIHIRGAETGDTLVLIDGVQMNDPSLADDSFDFGNLLVGDISRIEILRGSASTLYGSQAIGGVINIVTPMPTQDGLTADGQAEAGSLNTTQFKLGLGGKFDKLSFRIAGDVYNTNSVSAFDAQYGGKETDPSHNQTYTARATYDFTPGISLDLRGFYSGAMYNYDGFPPPAFVFADQDDYGTTRQFLGYAGLNVALFDGRLKNTFDYQDTSVGRGNYLNTNGTVTSTGNYIGSNHRLEYQGNLDIAPGYSAVFGFQHENSEIKSAAPALATSWITSGYAQLQGEVIAGLTLTAGGREDQHKTFGNHFTGQFSGAWDLDTGTILRASWGQGFKAPTLYQLYSSYGTPTLAPEESNSWDGGVEQHLLGDTLVLGATYFARHTTNLINFLSPVCPGAPQCATQASGYYANTGRTVADGVELQGSYTVTPGLVLSSNYTHDISRDHTPGPTYLKYLTRRPTDSWNTALDYIWDFQLSTGISVLYRSASYDNTSNTRKLTGYALINLRAAYPVLDTLDVYARMDNAADQYYETSYQYGTWGRTVFGGLKVHL